MNLPAPCLNRQVSAYAHGSRASALRGTTSARIVNAAGWCVYPRPGSAYKLRTPSPGGQISAQGSELSAFFVDSGFGAGVNDICQRPQKDGRAKGKAKRFPSCSSDISYTRLHPAPFWPPAAIRSPNSRWAVPSSVPVRRSLSAAVSCRARPSVPPVIWPTASLTRGGATDRSAGLKTLHSPHATPACGPLRLRSAPLRSLTGQISPAACPTVTLLKKDIRCSARS